MATLNLSTEQLRDFVHVLPKALRHQFIIAVASHPNESPYEESILGQSLGNAFMETAAAPIISNKIKTFRSASNFVAVVLAEMSKRPRDGELPERPAGWSRRRLPTPRG